jgi:hypothetical protein
VVWGAAERLNHGEAEDAARRRKRGGGVGGLRGVAGLGLGHGVIKGLFCRAAGSHWRAGPGREGRRNFRAAGARGGRRGEEVGEALTCGTR